MRVRQVAVFLVALVVVPLPAEAWQADLLPADRFGGALLTLDYERPWPGLDIQRGRAGGGIPAPAGLWLGGRITALRTPTVRETRVGGWLAARRWLLVAVDRTEIRVADLEPERRIDAEAALQVVSGALSCGWYGRAEGVTSPLTSVWRHWWVGVALPGVDLAIGRRATPWTDSPAWTAAVRLSIARGLDSSIGWRDGEATIAIALVSSFARVTTSTGWTGPRAGGFGFRLKTGRP